MFRVVQWGPCIFLVIVEIYWGMLLWKALTYPLVSVVMPIYNREDFLDKSIDSVLSQTFSDFELLLLDDGSSDGTWQKMQAYAQKDKRIRLLKNPVNRGISFSRNRLLEHDKGTFVAMMDSDDTAKPNWLLRSVHALVKHTDVSIVYPSAYVYWDSDPDRVSFFRLSPVIDMLNDNAFSNVGVVFRRDFVNRHHIRYDETILAAEDYDFWAQCLMKGAKAFLINAPLVQIRNHRTNPTYYYHTMARVRNEVARRLSLHFGISPENINKPCLAMQEVAEHNRQHPYFSPEEIEQKLKSVCKESKE